MRNRKTNVKDGMSNLESAVSESVLKIRLMPTRAKFAIMLSLIFSVVFYLYVAHWIFSAASDEEKALETLLETDKCPACFGFTSCGMLYQKQIKLLGSSKYRLLDMINGKNVHFGHMEYEGKDVVLKKLATDSELRAMDKKLCEDAKRNEGCDIARVIVKTDVGLPMFNGPLTPSVLEKTDGFMFKCPSYRLVDRMMTYFKEFKRKNEVFLSDKMQILYTAFLNPEPLLLQVKDTN